MKIKNFDQLATTELRRSALLIAEAGLQAIDTKKTIKDSIRLWLNGTDRRRNNTRLEGGAIVVGGYNFPLADIGRIIFVGIGKVASESAVVAEKILGERLAGGILVDTKAAPPLKKIKAFKGTHPLPSAKNVAAAKAVVKILDDLKEEDLVIFVVSGGGSTLLCLPENGKWGEEAKIMKALIKKGAAIQEINTLRKHLSLARGGYLAKYAYPASAVSLIFSDIAGDALGFVASGPTVKDETTTEDAEKIIEKYDITRELGAGKLALIETPKENKYFEKVKNVLVVSNSTALEVMETEAAELGFKAQIMTSCLTGEAADVGSRTVENLHEISQKSAFLYGGETTVTVKGKGRGGRNLELALSALRGVREGELLLSLASDGRDNGEFAGAICDTITKEAVLKNGFDIETVLQNNDSYPLFQKVGNHIETGDTGSNVSDLLIALKM